MKLINLTPHAINLPGGTVPPSGSVARVSMSSVLTDDIEVDGFVDTVAIVQPTYGEVLDLPDQQMDTLYIVSTMVQAASGRKDLLAPADLQRDDQGRVVGANALALPVQAD